MTTNAQRGTAFERTVRADLVTRGYVVVRSTVSHTPADLVGLWRGDGFQDAVWTAPDDGDWLDGLMLPTVLVQAKRDGRLDPTDWNTLYELARTSRTHALLAKPVREGRRSVVGYWLLTGRKIAGQRNPPMLRVHPPEVSDAEES